MIFVVILVLWSIMQPALGRLAEGRWWRDVTRQTPFRDVVVLSVNATELELMVSGTLVKDRECASFGSAIAQIIDDGISYPAVFDTRESVHTPNNRPVSKTPQSFGPWVVRSPLPWPEKAAIYRSHVCDGDIQTNLVLMVDWPREK